MALPAALFALGCALLVIAALSMSDGEGDRVGVSPDAELATSVTPPPACPLCTELAGEIAALKSELEAIKSHLSRTVAEGETMPATDPQVLEVAIERYLSESREQTALQRDHAEARKRVGYQIDHPYVRENADPIVEEVASYYREMRLLCFDSDGVSKVPLRGTADRAAWQVQLKEVRSKAASRLQAYMSEGAAESFLKTATPEEYLENQ